MTSPSNQRLSLEDGWNQYLLESTAVNFPSIFIPHVSAGVTEAMVASYLGHLELGIVRSVRLIPQKANNRHSWPPKIHYFNHAIVDFECWSTANEYTNQIRANLIRGKRQKINVMRTAHTLVASQGVNSYSHDKWELRLSKRSREALAQDPPNIITCTSCLNQVDLNQELQKPGYQQFQWVSRQDYAPGVCGKCNQMSGSLSWHFSESKADDARIQQMLRLYREQHQYPAIQQRSHELINCSAAMKQQQLAAREEKWGGTCTSWDYAPETLCHHLLLRQRMWARISSGSCLSTHYVMQT